MVSLFPAENRFQTQPPSCGGEPYIFVPDLIYSILHIPISWSLSFRHSLVRIYLWMMAEEIPSGPDHRPEGNILFCDRSIRKYRHTCVTGCNWDMGIEGKPVMGRPTKADQMCPKGRILCIRQAVWFWCSAKRWARVKKELSVQIGEKRMRKRGTMFGVIWREVWGLPQVHGSKKAWKLAPWGPVRKIQVEFLVKESTRNGFLIVWRW